MFTLTEVILLVSFVTFIVSYIAYRLAEFHLIVKMLSTLTAEELDKLDKLKQELESTDTDEEAAAVIEQFSKRVEREQSKTLIQEVLDGTTYLYDENNTFVAQGATASLAALNFFNSRHSSEVATVKCSEGNTYRIINGKIES